MENNTIPSEYLLHDPRDINPLHPGYTSKNPRLIDYNTRCDLVDILNGLVEAAEMVPGTPGCKHLLTQMKAIVSIVSESTEGVKS